MRRPLFHYTAFFVGLAAVCWVAIGYLGSNPLALAITLLIGAFYVMGALELQRFHQATATLTGAVTDLTTPPANLGPWLGTLHPSLRNAVRLRVEGERVGLPGPALTPYLAGLLVLLGMLGTFVGMVVTLNGTGMALESASDVSAIRASLAAPVKGLGLAFGTSLAGVAASAMLGLVSALCRRDRLQAAQVLDTRIGTTLRTFSLAHRREFAGLVPIEVSLRDEPGADAATPASEVPNASPKPLTGAASEARMADTSDALSSAMPVPLSVTTMPTKVPSMPSSTSSPAR